MKLSSLVFKTSEEAKQYISSLGITNWNGFKFCCPYHADNNPSCMVYPTIIYCHGCQRAATYSQATMQIKSVPFPAAVTDVKSFMGITEEIEFDFKDNSTDNTAVKSTKNSISKPFNRTSPSKVNKESFRFDFKNPDVLKGNFEQALCSLFQPEEYVAIRIDLDSSAKFGKSIMFITTRDNWISKTYDHILKNFVIVGAYMIPNPIKPESYTKWKEAYTINPDIDYSVGDEDILERRHLLVECDYMETKKQLEAYELSRLPIKVIIHSGANSLHAIIDIKGITDRDYGTDVYKRLQAWGIDLDTRCNTKSRWCRIAGFERHSIKIDPMTSSYHEDRGFQYIIIPSDAKDKCSTIDEWFKIWDEANPPPEQVFLEKVRKELESGLQSGNTYEEIMNNLSSSMSKITNENMNWKLCKSSTMKPKHELIMKPYVIEGIGRTGDIILFGADSKGKKSFSLLSLALAKSIGSTWFDKKISKGKTLYCDFELDEQDFLWRLYKIKEERELIYGDVFPDPIPGFDFVFFRNFNQNLDLFLNKLLELVKHGNYNLIILDPIYKIFNGEVGYDENNNAMVAQALIKLGKIAFETDTAVLITHHFKKNTKDIESAMDKFSGAGVFGRFPDAILAMSIEYIEDVAYFTLSHNLRHFKDPGDQEFRNYSKDGIDYISLVPGKKPEPVSNHTQKYLPHFAVKQFEKICGKYKDDGRGRLMYLMDSEFDYQKYRDYVQVVAWIASEPIVPPSKTEELLN